MFALMNRLRGYVRVLVSSDMPERFITDCIENGIVIISAERCDALRAELIMSESDLKAAEKLALRSGCELKVLKQGGGKRLAGSAAKRIAPIIMTVCFIGLLFWSKFYVWEIDIRGNEIVDTGEILDALGECGVECGAFWPAFSSDNIRSELLSRIPELSWITVNMHGSLAEVIAVERTIPPPLVFDGACADVIADCEGFVTKVEALVGEAKVKSGAAVSKGDVLISGVVESSYSPPRFLRSYGSVEAEINTALTAVSPASEQKRIYTGKKTRKFALIMGNNRINFYSGSSISDVFCDKIISVWKFEVPGIFSFPISFVCESSNVYEKQSADRDGYEVARLMEQILLQSLNNDIGDGEIIGSKLNYSDAEGMYTACLRARCRKDIGVSRTVSDERIAEAEMKFTQKADEDIWQREE